MVEKMKKYLLNLCLFLAGFVIGIIYMIYQCGYILESTKRRADKYFKYFNLLDKWLLRKERKENFFDSLKQNGIKSAAIYGVGKIGKHLKHELEKEGIQVQFVIDEGENMIHEEDEHYNLRDKLPLADVVIVTPIDEFEEIKGRILNNNKFLKVISAEEFIK